MKAEPTDLESLIAAQEALFDPAADPDGCPGLAVVLQESMNDVPALDTVTSRKFVPNVSNVFSRLKFFFSILKMFSLNQMVFDVTSVSLS